MYFHISHSFLSLFLLILILPLFDLSLLDDFFFFFDKLSQPIECSEMGLGLNQFLKLNHGVLWISGGEKLILGWWFSLDSWAMDLWVCCVVMKP